MMDIGKIPYKVLDALLERGVDEEQIAGMTAFQAFCKYCEYHGLIGWSDTLWNIVLELQVAGQDNG